jgi:hypothetical protein
MPTGWARAAWFPRAMFVSGIASCRECLKYLSRANALEVFSRSLHSEGALRLKDSR